MKRMKNKIFYSKESRRDLDKIWHYIASELQNPAAAKRIVNRIMDAIDTLADFAGAGAPLASVADVESDHRFLVTGNYLTFYRVCQNEVYVDRVLYGRRDYLRILFGEMTDGEITESD